MVGVDQQIGDRPNQSGNNINPGVVHLCSWFTVCGISNGRPLGLVRFTINPYGLGCIESV